MNLGLTLHDIDELDVGMMTDIITESNNLTMDGDKQDGYRIADQKDFDKF